VSRVSWGFRERIEGTARPKYVADKHRMYLRMENCQTDTLGLSRKYAPRNDVFVNDRPHIRQWSHKIMIKYNINLLAPEFYI